MKYAFVIAICLFIGCGAPSVDYRIVNHDCRIALREDGRIVLSAPAGYGGEICSGTREDWDVLIDAVRELERADDEKRPKPLVVASPATVATPAIEPSPKEDIDYWIKKNPAPVYTQKEVDMWGIPQRMPGGGTRTTFGPQGTPFYIKD